MAALATGIPLAIYKAIAAHGDNDEGCGHDDAGNGPGQADDQHGGRDAIGRGAAGDSEAGDPSDATRGAAFAAAAGITTASPRRRSAAAPPATPAARRRTTNRSAAGAVSATAAS